jgi:hypothetical protein
MFAPRTVLAAAALTLSGVPLRAQVKSTPASAGAGDTVRLFTRSTELVHGIPVRRDSMGLVVVQARTRDTTHTPTSAISRAEVQRGSHRRACAPPEAASSVAPPSAQCSSRRRRYATFTST